MFYGIDRQPQHTCDYGSWVLLGVKFRHSVAPMAADLLQGFANMPRIEARNRTDVLIGLGTVGIASNGFAVFRGKTAMFQGDNACSRTDGVDGSQRRFAEAFHACTGYFAAAYMVRPLRDDLETKLA